MERYRNAIEPLASPLAGPVVVVLPTRDQYEKNLRMYGPGSMNQEQITNHATMGLETSKAIVRLIERRNIFEQTQIIHRGGTPVDIKAPRGGYLLWVNCTLRTCPDYYMSAVGGSAMIELEVQWPGTESEYLRQLLRAVENFVKSHRPSTALQMPLATPMVQSGAQLAPGGKRHG